MTVSELKRLFKRHGEEYLEFDRVENRLSRRPDLHAFLLLDRLVPGDRDMVCAAEHDEVYLGVEPEDLAPAATEADVVELLRCGVRLGQSGLCMFV